MIIETTLWEIAWVTFTAMIGMISIGAGIVGYWYRKVNWLERIIGRSRSVIDIPREYVGYYWTCRIQDIIRNSTCYTGKERFESNSTLKL